MAGDGSGDSKKTPAAGTTAGAVDANADSKELAEGMADVRKLLQRTGAFLGAGATAVIGGLGYTRLHEIFPVPETASWLSKTFPFVGSKTVIIATLVAAVVGSTWLAARFFWSQRRILVRSTVEGDDDETNVVRAVYEEHAAEEGAASLLALELRALRLLRVSRRATGQDDRLPSKETVKKEADRLQDVVNTTMGRAAAVLLEDRARRAFGFGTLPALVLAVAGTVGLFAMADYYKGEREVFDARQKCAQAESAGVVNACAPFEARELTVRRIADQIKAAVEARKAASAAGPAATATQKALIDRVAACVREVNANKATKDLDAEVKSAAIALCASSE